MLSKKSKETALIVALVSSSRSNEGSVLELFDENYKIASLFIKKYPFDFDWEDYPIDIDEAVEIFIQDYKTFNLMNRSKNVLTLKISPLGFEAIISGEKKEEYRAISAWSKHLLYKKDMISFRTYDFVLFVSGGPHRPFLYSEFKGLDILDRIDHDIEYSNGLKVNAVEYPMFKIKLGDVKGSGNIYLQ